MLYEQIIAVVVGIFWAFFVLLTHLIYFIKNPIKYLASPVTVRFPDIVNDSKYGKSCIRKIKTTTGKDNEEIELDIHFVQSGETNSKTLLFIHGFPEFWYSYRDQITYFNKKFRVIAVDLRGYGKSAKPTNVSDYKVMHLSNDIKGLLNALDINSVILIGHDWGGAVAWNVESTYPEMVEKLILLNIPDPIAFGKIMKTHFSQFLRSWYIFYFQMPFLPEWSASRFDMEMIKSAFCSKKMGLQVNKLSDDDIKAYKANMAQKDVLTCAINYYRATVRYREESLKKLKNKRSTAENRYMLIFGECDNAIITECALETKRRIPSLHLKMLPGISHWVQQDDPNTVNKLIEEFINL